MSETELQIANFLDFFKNDISTLAQQLRTFLKEETKPTFELVGDSTISVNIGYGYTEKAWDCYCAIIVYSKHINISFPSGVELSDPQKLLHGTGKRIRHLKIKEFNDIKTYNVVQLLLEARDNALEFVENDSSNNNNIKTIIKSISGVKRRPK
jgi:hypothetical protein